MAYETFEHTADVGVRGIGNSFEEALQEAAKAMYSVMINLKRVKPSKSVKMEVVIDIARDLILPINFELQGELDPESGECAYCKKFLL